MYARCVKRLPPHPPLQGNCYTIQGGVRTIFDILMVRHGGALGVP